MKISTAVSIAVFMAAFFFVRNGICGDREFIDSLGRAVRVPENPERVITLAPSLTEVVFALGQGHRLAGATRFSNYPPEAKRLPKVGSYVHLDLEKIMALQPDLCLAVKDGNPPAIIQRLENLKVPVYAIGPQKLDEVAGMLIDIGDILNAGPQAKLLVEDMTRRIEAVLSTVPAAKHKPKVFFQIGISPIVSVGDDTFIHELITLAGGVNLVGGKNPYPRLTREDVIALAPDVFIITSMARDETFDFAKAFWQKWKSIPAVENDRIYLVDSDIMDRPTPRLVDGLELLARLFHPGLFKDAP